MESIARFVNKRIVVLHQESSILQAARAMCENNIGCILVSDRLGHVVGIVTDRDLACYALAFDVSSQAALSEAMTFEPLCITEDASLDEALNLMKENGIRRIPVVTAAGKCVGLITLDDLIATKSIDLDTIAQIVKSQVGRSLARKKHGQNEERHENRTAQTLARFEKVVAEASGLPKATAMGVVQIILSALVRRLTYTGAANFVSQLPQILQEDLLSLPAGPDRHVTAEQLIEDVSSYLGVAEGVTAKVVRRCWAALGKFMDPHELEKVKAQLPKDMAGLFVKHEKSTREDFMVEFKSTTEPFDKKTPPPPPREGVLHKVGDAIERAGDVIEKKVSHRLGGAIEKLGDKIEHLGEKH